MKNSMKMFSAALLALIMCVTTAPMAQAEDDQVTHDEAAVMIANMLGLYKGTDGPLTPLVAFKLLRGANILPSEDGWDDGEVMTIAQFARVMVGVLKLNDQVTDKSDPKAYIEVLKKQGVGVEDISSGLGVIQVPFSFFVGGTFTGISNSDPLLERPVLGEPDEQGFGVDVGSTPFDPGAPISTEDFSAAITFLELATNLSKPKPTTSN